MRNRRLRSSILGMERAFKRCQTITDAVLDNDIPFPEWDKLWGTESRNTKEYYRFMVQFMHSLIVNMKRELYDMDDETKEEIQKFMNEDFELASSIYNEDDD